MYVYERKSACDRLVETVVNGYEREGGLYLEHVCDKTPRERVSEHV